VSKGVMPGFSWEPRCRGGRMPILNSDEMPSSPRVGEKGPGGGGGGAAAGQIVGGPTDRPMLVGSQSRGGTGGGAGQMGKTRVVEQWFRVQTPRAQGATQGSC
jgi:hypothetical protein